MAYMAHASHLCMYSLGLGKVMDSGCAYLIVVDQHSSSILSLKSELRLLSIYNGLCLSVGLSLCGLIG